ncbi:MAG: AAA family ATPase, partial [Patescibacteria group bacterium]|nr:AAA family ATPase [Patescibacteria group bacterium]
MNTGYRIPSFQSFFLGEGLASYTETLKNIVLFIVHFFSIPNLIATIFKPWKRAYKTRNAPGLSFSDIFDVFTFNLLSRCIGAIIRLTTIVFGIIIVGIMLLLSILLVIVWFIFPPLPFLLYKNFLNRYETRFINDSDTDAVVWESCMKTEFGKFLTTRLQLRDSPALSSSQRTVIVNTPSLADFLVQWYGTNPSLQQFFHSYHIKKEDVIKIAQWWKRCKDKPGILSKESLMRIPSIGKTWTYGYTPTLDTFTTPLADFPIPYQMNARIKEMRMMEQILMKTHHNSIFLVGEPGVGKHPFLIFFAHEIAKGIVYPQLEGKRMLSFEMEKLFGQFSDTPTRKNTIATVLEEAQKAGNIILVIEDFDRYIATGQNRDDISDVFIHVLARGNISIIAAVTPESFHTYIRPNTQLTQYFEVLPIVPVNKEQTQDILIDMLPLIENNRIVFTYQSLREIVELCDTYIPEKVFPEKARDIIENVVSSLSVDQQSHQEFIVTPEIVRKIFTEKEGIPISITQGEAEKLLHLESLLHNRIVGQDTAMTTIAATLRRSRSDVAVRKKRPMGVFLFLGPTGVGKTETAKSLAEIFFGNTEKLVRLDMNEYVTPTSTQNILGDPQSGNVGVFLPHVRELKYGVILLDEFEKAHQLIKQVFLTIFDEGYIMDAFGKTVSFTNTILIATSNAGAELIRERLQNQQMISDEVIVEYIQTHGIYSPELLNRFDSIIVFRPLTIDHAREILRRAVKTLSARVYDTYG